MLRKPREKNFAGNIGDVDIKEKSRQLGVSAGHPQKFQPVRQGQGSLEIKSQWVKDGLARHLIPGNEAKVALDKLTPGECSKQDTALLR